jgi:deazaflavin-dependent oxidoreductase (nitroreductase family)
MKSQNPLLDRVRTFNKRFLNRLFLKFAGVSRTPFAVIRHVGRRSGKPYETPIIVMPGEGGFVVALTYGPEVDWYRNVIAAGQCGLLWHGNEYAIEEIKPMDKQAALAVFPFPFSPILRLLGMQHFVSMKYQTGGTTTRQA